MLDTQDVLDFTLREIYAVKALRSLFPASIKDLGENEAIRGDKFRSMMWFGTPLEGFSDPEDRKKQMNMLFTTFYNDLETKLKESKLVTDNFYVDFSNGMIINSSFFVVANQDFYFCSGTFLFVYI